MQPAPSQLGLLRYTLNLFTEMHTFSANDLRVIFEILSKEDIHFMPENSRLNLYMFKLKTLKRFVLISVFVVTRFNTEEINEYDLMIYGSTIENDMSLFNLMLIEERPCKLAQAKYIARNITQMAKSIAAYDNQ